MVLSHGSSAVEMTHVEVESVFIVPPTFFLKTGKYQKGQTDKVNSIQCLPISML